MKVSVIVPCYNQAQYLDTALQSVLSQTYQDWECIIINDGSLDNTEDIGRLWQDKDSRFTYCTKKNGGLPGTRNFGIEKATGVYILPLDADDYISSNYIEECVKELESKNVKLVYGKVEQFGSRTGEWDLGAYSYNDLLVSNMIHCTAMYRKEDWKDVGGYDENMVYGLEDWEFWVHMLHINDHVSFVKEIIFYYRIKEVSMITIMDKTKEMEVKEYVFNKHASKYFLPFTDISSENKLLKKNLTSISFVFRRFVKLLFRINRFKK